MPIWLKRGCPKSRGKFRVLLSSKHKGLKEHPKTLAWKRGFRSPPDLLQQTLDYFDGKEEDVYDVLTQLEQTAKLCPGIWRVEIVLRTLRDPWNEDADFPSDGYIMGQMIPFEDKLPVMYFRLLAFRWKMAWKKHYWKYDVPLTVRLVDPAKPKT